MADITEGDADDWRIWLAQQEKSSDGKPIKRKLGPNTVRRRCGRARQLFQAAAKRNLIANNPFGNMKGIAVQANKEREYFVTRAEADKVLAECPDAEWGLIFTLSRYGGLRCPSEHLALYWGDVSLDAGTLTVHSSKTEQYEGHESRVVPIFPELRPHIERVFNEFETCNGRPPASNEPVITRYRDSNSNLRTQLQRIMKRAGVKQWPKLFQNMRSSRQTELQETFAAHVVCAWMGNSEAVAKKHYLQVTEEHIARALRPDETKDLRTHKRETDEVAQNPAHQPAPIAFNVNQAAVLSSRNTDCIGNLVTPTGLEPVLPA